VGQVSEGDQATWPAAMQKKNAEMDNQQGYLLARLNEEEKW
jgi:hypothetical protein